MTNEQAEKLAIHLDVTVCFIWRHYIESDLLADFYLSTIKRKGY